MPPSVDNKKLRIGFIHPDLGIGELRIHHHLSATQLMSSKEELKDWWSMLLSPCRSEDTMSPCSLLGMIHQDALKKPEMVMILLQY